MRVLDSDMSSAPETLGGPLRGVLLLALGAFHPFAPRAARMLSHSRRGIKTRRPPVRPWS